MEFFILVADYTISYQCSPGAYSRYVSFECERDGEACLNPDNSL